MNRGSTLVKMQSASQVPSRSPTSPRVTTGIHPRRMGKRPAFTTVRMQLLMVLNVDGGRELAAGRKCKKE